MKLPNHLEAKLDERKAQKAYRQLRLPNEALTDFCSNDYLGIVKNNLLLDDENLHKNKALKTGSTGSRLLRGNYPLIEETEMQIASFHKAEAALIFNSGYDANVGILSSLAQKGDTIIYDALCHASIRDGIRLSFVTSFSFLHNNVDDLQKKINAAKGNIFVVTESVFSMDGDVCPLKEMVRLCNKYGAFLIVDEAHAIGVIGKEGEGLVQHLQLHHEVFCRIYTFGKACGCHGAVAVGSSDLKSYLINFSRSFIYSTSLPEQSVYFIKKSYAVFPHLQKEREHLQTLIQQFQNAHFSLPKLTLQTPIQAVIVKGNEEVKKRSKRLEESGIDVRPVLYPTVPKDSERLRIILHSFNTKEEVEQLIEALKNGQKQTELE